MISLIHNLWELFPCPASRYVKLGFNHLESWFFDASKINEIRTQTELCKIFRRSQQSNWVFQEFSSKQTFPVYNCWLLSICTVEAFPLIKAMCFSSKWTWTWQQTFQKKDGRIQLWDEIFMLLELWRKSAISYLKNFKGMSFWNVFCFGIELSPIVHLRTRNSVKKATKEIRYFYDCFIHYGLFIFGLCIHVYRGYFIKKYF